MNQLWLESFLVSLAAVDCCPMLCVLLVAAFATTSSRESFCRPLSTDTTETGCPSATSAAAVCRRRRLDEDQPRWDLSFLPRLLSLPPFIVPDYFVRLVSIQPLVATSAIIGTFYTPERTRYTLVRGSPLPMIPLLSVCCFCGLPRQSQFLFGSFSCTQQYRRTVNDRENWLGSPQRLATRNWSTSTTTNLKFVRNDETIWLQGFLSVWGLANS